MVREEQRAAEGNGEPTARGAARRGNSEEVRDAVFDFAEHLIAQQRIFAKQMLAAANAQHPAPQAATAAPAPAGRASADPMGPGRSSSPEAEGPGVGPIGPGHNTTSEPG